MNDNIYILSEYLSKVVTQKQGNSSFEINHWYALEKNSHVGICF